MCPGKQTQGQLFKTSFSLALSHPNKKMKQCNWCICRIYTVTHRLRMQSFHLLCNSLLPSLKWSYPRIALGCGLCKNCFCLQLIGFFPFFQRKNALKILFFIVSQTTWAQQTDFVLKVTYQHWQRPLKNSCCLIDCSVNIPLNLETILLRWNIAHLAPSP